MTGSRVSLGATRQYGRPLEPQIPKGGNTMPLRDPTLEHQVVIAIDGNHITVSCNCRWVSGAKLRQGGRGPSHYDSIGVTHNTNDVKRLYNDPSNHWKPFSQEWALRYEESVFR